jgi:hypothetical protein
VMFMVETVSRPGKRETYNLKMVNRYSIVNLIKLTLLFLLAWNPGETFDRDREQDKPFTKSFQRLLKKLKRRQVRAPPVSKDTHTFRCRVCPGCNCILITRGKKLTVRQICFEYPGEDNHTMWEDVTGIEGDSPR